ncbi:exonuclease VII large subunit [Tetragenococcus halophilus subsp. halophilus]|uniref:Exodeoxyribonuclease 7 large subunit n=3 Tax=Tetragenococcus halophilus TaxID=51669 RepID=A0A2H6CSB7_TETHA|nr:exodeoxyribonuclease VII large subunit [Tetragenococcus halophilus]AOF49413.1 exodeoxyribonuclease VII large subunit [Tetragenococcus halophilus]AYW51134.1 exodeoxyribonuclease VII large subunit [Tetragenococcus halophilus]MCF1601357.1 exodeoxyribonuclease VII large subunit [Tetragenococcus halophilus]MCF1674724.1 exodeoxyribonuclease VII large subunit [Tetragenococcus halophilus]MCO8283824.1 exodeoxyribonuclease VII large subunit [Tetragenococcus halophilus]
MEYLTVSALTKYLKRKFDADPYLEKVFLTGEISNFRLRPNHQYFSIKDDKAKISAVMFKNAFRKLNFQPEEGMKVMVVGRLSIYETTGNYQIYIDQMQPDGIGALYQAYEQLKKKLEAEGLFQLPKKTLPRFPKRIAVLTSPSGAVIRDIMTTAKRRYPIAQIVLFPTVVQGEKAADDVVKNLQGVKEQGNFDTVIIGRGGGSIEDLWPFNEERVARAIVACDIPVISSVGHETDTTIADLVADVRAATPTAAAELAVPVLSEEILRIEEKQARLQQAYIRQIQRKQERFQRVQNSYIFRQPERLYEAQSIKLDQLNQRMNQSLQRLVYEKEKNYTQIDYRFKQAAPHTRVKEAKQEVEYLKERLKNRAQQIMTIKQQAFEQTVQALDLLSPLKIMGRGYSYTTKDTKVVKSVQELAKEDHLNIHYKDGRVQTKVIEIEEDEDGRGNI